MNSKADAKTRHVESSTEIVTNFDVQRLAAPFFLRCGALLIDYILFVLGPVAMLLLGRYFGSDGSKLITGSLNDTGWLIAVLAGGANFLLLPLFSGQSVGKLVTGLRIVRTDGRHAGPARIALRQTLGYSITLITAGLGFLLSTIVPSGRSLHDLLFGTVVVYANRKYK